MREAEATEAAEERARAASAIRATVERGYPDEDAIVRGRTDDSRR